MMHAKKQWDLPFFEWHHVELANDLHDWINLQVVNDKDEYVACREWVTLLADGQWLRYCIEEKYGGIFTNLDSRSLLLIREILSQYSCLADFAFAMQGLGSGAITLAGNRHQKQSYLTDVGNGLKIGAFALSETEAGSDVSNMSTTATKTTSGFVLNGHKTWISNAGLANFYVVFAKTEPTAGKNGISAFIVDANTSGLDDSERISVMSPHPIGKLIFTDCHIPESALLGNINEGFILAMKTLDIFRVTVAGAALGMARRAFQEALSHAKKRVLFGKHLSDFQLTQARLAEMATLIDAAALLTYRAGWLKDSYESSNSNGDHSKYFSLTTAMAKWSATENAQKVIDIALQIHGAQGVVIGQKIESLYRDIRALRIYEGSSEIQQIIVGKSLVEANVL